MRILTLPPESSTFPVTKLSAIYHYPAFPQEHAETRNFLVGHTLPSRLLISWIRLLIRSAGFENDLRPFVPIRLFYERDKGIANLRLDR